MNEKLNKYIVAIYAHICCDGNMYIKSQKRSPSSIRITGTTEPSKRYVVEYNNTCNELLIFVRDNINNIFPGRYIYFDDKGKHRIQMMNKPLYVMLKNIGYIRGKEWDIPKEIIENEEFRRIWLRAFFDDEGSVYHNCIVGYNTNRKAILKIIEMLELEDMKIGVYERIPKNPKHRVCYTIKILSSSFLDFKKIGFNHPEKKKKYEEYRKIRMRRPGLLG